MSPAGPADNQPQPSYRNAVAWSYLLMFGRTFGMLFVSLLLARILGPEAFGLVAMASVFIAFLDLMVRQGLIAAIVQRADLDDTHLDAAFWITLLTIIALTPISVLLSSPWASLNGTPELETVILGMTPLVALRGLSVVQEARMQRMMQFRPLAIRSNAGVLSGGVAGISLALSGFGVWALVAQHLISALVELVLLWWFSSWRPSRKFSMRKAKDLLSFSGRVSVAGIGVFATQRADAMMIGLFFGPTVVGLYRIAHQLVELSLNVATGALHITSLPELSRYQNQQIELNKRAAEIIRLGGVIVAPLLGTLFVSSGPLIALLGGAWIGAVDALRVFCVLGIVQSVAMFSGPMLLASGRPGFHAGLTWLTGAISILSLVAAGLWISNATPESEVLQIALFKAILVGGLLVFALPMLMKRSIGTRVSQFYGAIAPSLLGSIFGVGLSLLLVSLLLSELPFGPLLTFLSVSLIAAVCCGTGVLACEPLARKLLVQMARAGLFSLRSSKPGADP